MRSLAGRCSCATEEACRPLGPRKDTACWHIHGLGAASCRWICCLTGRYHRTAVSQQNSVVSPSSTCGPPLSWCCLVPCIISACLSLSPSCALHLLQRPPKSFGKGVTKHFEELSSIEGSQWEVESVGVEAPLGFGLSSSFPGEFGRGGYQAVVTFLGCRVAKVQPNSPWICHWLVLAFLSCALQCHGTEEQWGFPLSFCQSSEKERQGGVQ